MNKKERTVILQHVKDRAEVYAFYREMGMESEAETASYICIEIEHLAEIIGIPYAEIESAANEGSAHGERNARRRKANEAAWKASVLYLDRETGTTLTRAELEQEFEQLKSDDPETYNYTFSEYLRECLSKNGSLMEV